MPDNDDDLGCDTQEEAVEPLAFWLQATSEDVLSTEVDKPILSKNLENYHVLTSVYSQASNAEELYSSQDRKVFALIGAVLSMHLKDDSPNEPFGPMMVIEGGRSPDAADFRSMAEVLAIVAERSAHPLVKARFADLAWLLERRRSKCAQVAIDSYVQAAFDMRSGTLEFKNFPGRRDQHPDIKKVITRALQVARGARKQKLQTEQLNELTRNVFGEAVESGWSVGVLWFGRLVLANELQDTKLTAERIEKFLRAPANKLTWISPLVDIWKLLAHCYRSAGLTLDEHRCLSEACEAYVRHALSQEHSAMVRASFLSDAIQQLQGVPNQRERRNQIKLLLREAQSGVGDEMSTFSHEIDLSDVIKPTESMFEKLGLIDQLFAFALLDEPPEPELLRAQALKQISDHPLSTMFGTTIHDREGKVIEKTSSAKIGQPSEATITHTIARDESLRRRLVSAGRLEAARRVISESSFISTEFLHWVIATSPFVPRQLQHTYSYAFAKFIQGDFCAATYILTPLLEASILHVLKQYGIEVSNFDDQSETQEDKTISSLFKDHREDLDRIFGRANVYSLDGLYLSKFGPHLRHAIAHGMLSDGDPFGSDAIYGCWLIYKLCMQPLFPYRDVLKEAFCQR